MTNEEKIAALEQEVADLKVRIADIFDALVLETNNTTEHFAKLDDFLVEVINYLMPVVHKVFPKIAEGKKEIAAFLKNHRSSSGGKKSA